MAAGPKILCFCAVLFFTSQAKEYEESSTTTKTIRNPLLVEISTGKIEGRSLTTKAQNKPYYAFQGIRYAQPPIGNLRFSEPAPAEPWNETLQTHEDGYRCMHFVTSIGSEDCLFLSVFSPKNKNPVLGQAYDKGVEHNPLPVMVWINEGFFLGGSPKTENFGPDYFLDEDIIVVTVNYRVGIFGFLSTEDYEATGNWGLKDQILALKWMQENIKQFGGDSNNVTVFGQSAGAAWVSLLIQSPLAKGLFHRAILQSGTNLNQWAHAQNPRKTAFAVGRLLDIKTNDTKELVEQLRKIDSTTLLTVARSTDLEEYIIYNPLHGLVFGPHAEVNHPGAVFTNASHSVMKNGDFNRIPVIVGFNSQESLGYIDALPFLKPYVAAYGIFSTRLVPESLNIDLQVLKIVIAQLVRGKYFGWRPIIFSKDRIVQFVTDDQFVRPVYEYVKQSSKYAPTYFYVFSYEGPMGIDGQKREISGVAHGEENKYFWNIESTIDNPPHEDILTRKRLIRLWTNFAKTGNPTPVSEELLQNVTWPAANIKSMIYLNISQNLVLETDMEKYHIRFWDKIFTQHGNPPFHAY